MAHFSRYSKVTLMMEGEMTLYELIHETQPTRPLDAKALRWKIAGGWIGWFERLLAELGDNADYHRKV
ncbi:hypothetical protein [uncultured Maricaulis sp.]|uniref:hypothetical protein n=1 Tax=uncultured Maricaulis sp. TaxID=174710 RepID=UPI0030DD4A84|tara:strand:- start:70914 stop:71117 length:204 start_codon:yes stop_codon:yes gene_type:complete